MNKIEITQKYLSNLYSAELIMECRIEREEEYGATLGPPIQRVEERLNVSIDTASPLALRPFFLNPDGTYQKVLMAYPRDVSGFAFGIPIVCNVASLSNLEKYWSQ